MPTILNVTVFYESPHRRRYYHFHCASMAEACSLAKALDSLSLYPNLLVKYEIVTHARINP